MNYDGLIPVPPHLWHLTILSPFLRVPFPSQFLHGFFFSPALFGKVSSQFNRPNVRGSFGLSPFVFGYVNVARMIRSSCAPRATLLTSIRKLPFV